MPQAPQNELLPQLLAARSQEIGDQICIVDLSTGTSKTYAELHAEALQWAAAMAGQRIGRGDTVATVLHAGALPITIWAGLGWLGAMDVPVNAEYYGEMLSNVIQDAETRVVVTEGDFLDAVIDVLPACPLVEVVVVVGDMPSTRRPPSVAIISADEAFSASNVIPTSELAGPETHDIATIVYTSGTTGRSKGVQVPWQQVYECGVWGVPSEYLTSEDATYLPFPGHHLSFKGPAYAMIRLGGKVVTRRRFSTSNYWSEVREHGCTYGPLLGTMARLLQAAPAGPDDADNPMKYAAMVPPVEELASFERRFGVQVGTLFGMTELSIPIRSEGWRVRVIDGVASCGRARHGVEARVVDENDWPVPAGVLGELVIRYDDPWAMAVGYWKNPTATAETWRNAWFHTGDAVMQSAEGEFFYHDRIKDSIRRRGENISSAEVEALIGLHSSVREVAAIAVRAPLLGEDDVKVVVVPEEGATLTPREIHDFAVEKMPRFMRPRYIEIVEELPKTPTLKVRKAVLREAGVTPNTWDSEGEPPHSVSKTHAPSST